MSSLDVAVEDLAPSSSRRGRPIRWISFTLVRLLEFEQQGHHIPLFQAFFVQGPFFHLFFFLIVLLTSCFAHVV